MEIIHDKVSKYSFACYCKSLFEQQEVRTLCTSIEACILSMQRVIIYPAYIDAKKTVAQGRRVAKSKGETPACCLGRSFS